jgi:hypothetical protein
MAQHHLSREDDRAGVNLVQASVLGGSAVGSLPNWVSSSQQAWVMHATSKMAWPVL